MTPYSLLLHACGLSHREAAALHDVRLDTVKSWSNGRNCAPDRVIADLRALYARIDDAAAQSLATIRSSVHRRAVIEIGYPADDHEARALGLPCAGAWRAMAARVVAGIDRTVILVPRGSTPATAAASDAHGA